MTPHSEAIGRRAFLWTAALSGLAALFGEWIPQRWVSAAPTITSCRIPGATDLLPGSAVSFTLPGTTITGILVRLATDAYVAFDQRCPHLGCPVQWSPRRERFECPCHKAVFDGSIGRVVSGPPRRGLRRIAIERRGDDLWALHVGADEDNGSSERSV